MQKGLPTSGQAIMLTKKTFNSNESSYMNLQWITSPLVEEYVQRMLLGFTQK